MGGLGGTERAARSRPEGGAAAHRWAARRSRSCPAHPTAAVPRRLGSRSDWRGWHAPAAPARGNRRRAHARPLFSRRLSPPCGPAHSKEDTAQSLQRIDKNTSAAAHHGVCWRLRAEGPLRCAPRSCGRQAPVRRHAPFPAEVPRAGPAAEGAGEYAAATPPASAEAACTKLGGPQARAGAPAVAGDCAGQSWQRDQRCSGSDSCYWAGLRSQ